MVKFTIGFFLSILAFSQLSAQTIWYAVASASWTSSTTWNTNPNSSGTFGVPGSNDIVFTNGKNITIPSGSYTINSLYFESSTLNGLAKAGIAGSCSITITGEMGAYSGSFGNENYALPSVAVINNSKVISFIFNGSPANSQNYPQVIPTGSWSSSAPIKSISISPTVSPNTLSFGDNVAIADGGSLTVTSGTFEVDAVLQLASGGSSGTITVNTGTTLFVNSGNISGNSGSNSSFPTITVNGTMTSASNSTSYINASTFNLNSGATLNVGFNGVNQTLGWWYQSQTPSGIPNLSSTVIYNSSSSQNVYAQQYGNLTLDASAVSTKTLVGPSGALTVNGNFNINSANVTFNASSTMHFAGNLTSSAAFAPTGLVFLSGSGAVNIGGSGSYNFGGGLNVSSGSPTLSTNMTVSNGIIINGVATLNLSSNTVTLSGDLANNGSLTPSTSTLVIAGTTNLTGNATATLYNITVNSGGNLTGASTATIVNGALTNNGTFTSPISSSVTVNGAFTNGGTGAYTPASSSSLTTNGTFVNNGTFTAPSSLIINTDFTNNSTFNSNSGTVTFSNAGNQSISGTATTSFNHLNISNTAGTVSVNGTANLTGVLTLLSSSVGFFDADGSGSGVFTVKSTAVNVGGRIAALPQPANFSGNVTVERFINSPADWRYLSLPITSGNVGMWKTYFPVTGSFSDASPAGVNNVTSSSAPSIYFWNASLATPAWVALGSGGSTASTSLSNTLGYSPYTYMSGNVTVAVRGTIGSGNISVPLGTVGSAYNLIGNPYPSAIDWDNVTIPGNLSTTMSITQANNVFSAYVKGGAATNPPFSGWTGEVATGQSFWVQSLGATTLALTESAKTSNAFQFERTTPLHNQIRISLLAGAQKDESVIWFQDASTDSIDAFDAIKRKNGYDISPLKTESYINLSSYNTSSSQDFAINGIAPITCQKSVMLRLADVPVGTNKLLFTELSYFNLGYSISLIDHYLNKQVTVTDSLQYSFAVTSDTKSSADGRFEIQFSQPKPLVNVTEMVLTSNVSKGNQWLFNGVAIPGATGAEYTATQSGVYSVQVTTGSCSLTSVDVVMVVTGLESSEGIFKAYPNPVKDKLNMELADGFSTIKIFDAQGKFVESIDSSTVADDKSFQINASQYARGLYILRVSTTSGNFSVKIIKE